MPPVPSPESLSEILGILSVGNLEPYRRSSGTGAPLEKTPTLILFESKRTSYIKPGSWDIEAKRIWTDNPKYAVNEKGEVIPRERHNEISRIHSLTLIQMAKDLGRDLSQKEIQDACKLADKIRTLAKAPELDFKNGNQNIDFTAFVADALKKAGWEGVSMKRIDIPSVDWVLLSRVLDTSAIKNARINRNIYLNEIYSPDGKIRQGMKDSKLRYFHCSNMLLALRAQNPKDPDLPKWVIDEFAGLLTRKYDPSDMDDARYLNPYTQYIYNFVSNLGGFVATYEGIIPPPEIVSGVEKVLDLIQKKKTWQANVEGDTIYYPNVIKILKNIDRWMKALKLSTSK